MLLLIFRFRIQQPGPILLHSVQRFGHRFIFGSEILLLGFGWRWRTILIAHQVIFIIIDINGTKPFFQRIYLITRNFGMEYGIIFLQNTAVGLIFILMQIK